MTNIPEIQKDWAYLLLPMRLAMSSDILRRNFDNKPTSVKAKIEVTPSDNQIGLLKNKLGMKITKFHKIYFAGQGLSSNLSDYDGSISQNGDGKFPYYQNPIGRDSVGLKTLTKIFASRGFEVGEFQALATDHILAPKPYGEPADAIDRVTVRLRLISRIQDLSGIDYTSATLLELTEQSAEFSKRKLQDGQDIGSVQPGKIEPEDYEAVSGYMTARTPRKIPETELPQLANS